LARWAPLEFADVVSLGFFPLQPRFNEQMLNKYCIFDASGWLEACSSHYLNVSTGGWLFQCFKKKPEFGQPAGDLVTSG